MRAINHAYTGALIGLLLPQPALALPLALASHFICDAIPHHGTSNKKIAGRTFAGLLYADVLLCVVLIVVLSLIQPAYWLLVCAAAILATAPDFMWLPGYLKLRSGKPVDWSNGGWALRFHARIQWFERPIGAVVELAWFIGALTLLTLILI